MIPWCQAELPNRQSKHVLRSPGKQGQCQKMFIKESDTHGLEQNIPAVVFCLFRGSLCLRFVWRNAIRSLEHLGFHFLSFDVLELVLSPGPHRLWNKPAWLQASLSLGWHHVGVEQERGGGI